jgi:hypothetical protein
MEKARRAGRNFELVMAMHPHAVARIGRLLLSSPTFREICEDYLLLREMIADLDAQASPDIENRRIEYVLLAAELELDIERALARDRIDPAS